MNVRSLFSALLACSIAALGLAAADDAPQRGGGFGADVTVAGIESTNNWGEVGGVRGYSASSTFCNAGDQEVLWEVSTAEHPVVVQNLYRLEDGRFEQLGASWARHVFAALASNFCELGCQPPGTVARLGVGCSDTNSAAISGGQSRLGPRSEVEPATGVASFPFTGEGDTGDAIFKRLQVAESDLDPAEHPQARYFLETQVVARDDTAAGNRGNNLSYREVLVTGAGFDLVPIGQTLVGAALEAWQAADPTVQINTVELAGDGRLRLASRASDNGDGTWRYVWVLHNESSGRGVEWLAVPAEIGAVIDQVSFTDVDPHSGEPISGTDWTATLDAGGIRWSTEPFATDPQANALRWGTLYTFSFDADQPPATSQVQLGLFRPGGPARVFLQASAPGDTLVFSDGFESGDALGWSALMP